MGTLRVRYVNKISVFEYDRLRREDAVEKMCEHVALFGYEMIADPQAPKKTLDGGGFFAPVEVPIAETIFEWIENPGAKNETIETLAFPTAPQ